MPDPVSGRVFISYRRQDSSSPAGRLYDRLADRLGDDHVFIDVDTIEPGLDFADVIAESVSTCEVLLAVIGPRWLTATDEDGRRRLDDPDDIVRVEITAALERNIRVIPVLVEGAVIPRRQQLPEGLARLARRNAVSLRHESFRADVDRLLATIEPILRAPAAPVPHRPEATPAVFPGESGTKFQEQATSWRSFLRLRLISSGSCDAWRIGRSCLRALGLPGFLPITGRQALRHSCLVSGVAVLGW
jgi:hypothetical protein